LTPSSPSLHLTGYSHDIGLGGVFDLGSVIDSPKVARMSSMSQYEIPSFPWPSFNGAIATFSFRNESNTTVNAESSVADYWAKELVDFGDADAQVVDHATSSSQTLSESGELEPWRLQSGEMGLKNYESQSRIGVSATSSTQALLRESPPCSPKSQPTKLTNFHLDLAEKLSLDTKMASQGGEPEGREPKDEAIRENLLEQPLPRTSPIRQSISALRRMNSDAKEDNNRDSGMKGTERYFNVGPLSPKRGAEREGSWMSLLAEKVLFRNKSKMDLSQMPVDFSRKQERDSYINSLETKAYDVDVTDPAIALERQYTVPELAWPTNSGRPGAVNIWDDGEHYRVSSYSGAPMDVANGGVRALGDSTPLRINIQPPSNEATPRSLYDQKGFLIETHSNRLV
jgi:hypothetical protein